MKAINNDSSIWNEIKTKGGGEGLKVAYSSASVLQIGSVDSEKAKEDPETIQIISVASR